MVVAVFMNVSAEKIPIMSPVSPGAHNACISSFWDGNASFSGSYWETKRIKGLRDILRAILLSKCTYFESLQNKHTLQVKQSVIHFYFYEVLNDSSTVKYRIFTLSCRPQLHPSECRKSITKISSWKSIKITLLWIIINSSIVSTACEPWSTLCMHF